MIIHRDFLSGRDLALAEYFSALSEYRRLATVFAADLARDGQADRAAVRAAEARLHAAEEASAEYRAEPLAELADRFGVGSSTLRKFVLSGELRAWKRGKVWYACNEDVQRLIADGELKPKPRRRSSE